MTTSFPPSSSLVPSHHFASGLRFAVDEAWGSLSSLAKCSSHKDMCAIAGARIAKELHKKGATTGEDAFESFKSLCNRFTPVAHTLESVPVPNGDIQQHSKVSFNSKFDVILRKVQWSPTGQTSTSRTTKRPASSMASSAMSKRSRQ